MSLPATFAPPEAVGPVVPPYLRGAETFYRVFWTSRGLDCYANHLRRDHAERTARDMSLHAGEATLGEYHLAASGRYSLGDQTRYRAGEIARRARLRRRLKSSTTSGSFF